MGRAATEPGQANLRQRPPHLGLHLGLAQARLPRPKRHILLHRWTEELIIGILEH